MTKYYSANTKGFYDSNVHTADRIPVDAKEVSEERYVELFELQMQGRCIIPSKKGPVDVDPLDAISKEEALTGLRYMRDIYLKESDYSMYPDVPMSDEKRAEWTAYRQALRELPANTKNPKKPIWPIKPE